MGNYKPVHWIGTTQDAVKRFPKDVKDEIGFSLYLAQMGGKAINAVAMAGFAGKVVELVVDDNGDTFRAVYTVKFAEAIYVVHAFQKKAKSRGKTTRHDLKLLRDRLKIAEQDYIERYGKRSQQKTHKKGA